MAASNATRVEREWLDTGTPAVLEPMSKTTAEDVLAMLLLNTEAARAIRPHVTAAMFESRVMQDIAGRALAFYDQFGEAVRDHIDGELRDVLEGDDKKRARLYERVLANLFAAYPGLNVEYTLGNLHRFVREQGMKAAILKAVDQIEAGKLDEAEAELQKGLQAQPALAGAALNPFTAFDRWKVTKELADAMIATRMIWRDIIALSHLIVWAAPSGHGKTAIAKFAAGELAADGFTVLFFQEDASAGDLPAMHRHAEEHGYMLLNSSLSASSPEDQIKVLHELIAKGADLSKFVMIFDTLKKFLDLMSKSGARSFFQLLRGLTTLGATVLLLAHTNKHKGLDGKPIFEGVGDVRSDVDELLYLNSTDRDDECKVTVTITPDKVRCVVLESTFTIDTRTMTVEPQDRVVDVAAIRRKQDDAPLIECFRSVLRTHNRLGVSELLKAVHSESGKSRSQVLAVFERYVSEDDDSRSALWIETKLRKNNARIITLRRIRPLCTT